VHLAELLQLWQRAKNHLDHPVRLLSSDLLDPSIRRFVSEMSAAWDRHGDLAAASPAQARQIAEQVRAPWTRGGPEVPASEHFIPTVTGDVRVRVYTPDASVTRPALVYLHGGGWTLFSLDTHDRVMREYAARAGLAVVGVDYALAPEAKYPVALTQVVAVVRHLAKHGSEFGVDPLRIAIGGDSAGANLAIAAALRLRDEGDGALLRAMVLNYGVFARQSSPEARQRFGGPGNMLTADEMEGFWRNYLRDERDAEDPLVCPLAAYVRGLPPALLIVPECDLLAEQSLMLAGWLREAGVAVELKIYRGAVHSFLEAVSISPLAEQAFADTAPWLSAAIST
jgi:acetyl esterase